MTKQATSDQKAEHLVFARAYRPQFFRDLKGQETLVRILSQALRQERVAHAYLLTGTRGVGKTTTARLMAKALNCAQLDKTQDIPEPCGQCDNCQAIARGQHLDVIEVDAASRTGVDDIREIIDSVAYKPVLGRYKIYIIDEVHMLSKNAFNALLKTLEEPPAHVKFVFATTEFHKVPATIVSRCQSFHLKDFEVSELKTLMADILTREKIAFEEDALHIIARSAEGSARDALSLLEQVVSYRTEEGVTFEEAQQTLGMASQAHVWALLGALMRADKDILMQELEILWQSGAGSDSLLAGLLEGIHQLILLAAGHEKYVFMSHQQQEALADVLPQLNMGQLQMLWQVLLKGREELTYAPSARQALTVLLLRALYVRRLPPLDEISISAESSVPAQRQEQKKNELSTAPETFEKLLAALKTAQESYLAAKLFNEVSVTTYAPGHLRGHFKKNFTAQDRQSLGRFYQTLFGIPLRFEEEAEAKAPTLKEQAHLDEQRAKVELSEHPFVKEVLELIPGAQIESIVKKI